MHLTIDAARAARIKLWILIPTRELNCLAPHHILLLGLLRSHGIWYSLRTLPGDSLVTRARNNLASIFLSESTDDDDHFALWLDDDIVFDPAAVLQLIALDMDFVAAPYSKKGIHLDRVAEAARLQWPNDRMMAVAGTPNVNWLAHPIRCDEPMPVLEAGTGFWLTKRKVFRRMIDELPDIKFRRSNEEHSHYGECGYDFFRVGVWPETREYLSEDWWFCREWRKLGGTVYCCFWIKTNHIGPYLYPMDMPAIADLLTATGGYINAETRPNKEPHAIADTQQAHSAAPDRSNGHAGAGIAPDILRAIARATDQAAGPRDPGTLGG